MAQISGHVDSAFKQVREVFEQNFEADSALAGSWGRVLCLYRRPAGRRAKSGGVADQESGRACGPPIRSRTCFLHDEDYARTGRRAIG